MEKKPSKLIWAYDIAYRLDCTVERVIKWGRNGTIPGAVIIDSKHIRFDPETVERFIRAGGNRALEIALQPKVQRPKESKCSPALTRGGLPKVPKALRFDQKKLGPLDKYKPERVGRIVTLASADPSAEQMRVLIRRVEEDFYPKLQDVEWNADLDHPHRQGRPDLSRDEYERPRESDEAPVNLRFSAQTKCLTKADEEKFPAIKKRMDRYLPALAPLNSPAAP